MLQLISPILGLTLNHRAPKDVVPVVGVYTAVLDMATDLTLRCCWVAKETAHIAAMILLDTLREERAGVAGTVPQETSRTNLRCIVRWYKILEWLKSMRVLVSWARDPHSLHVDRISLYQTGRLLPLSALPAT